LTPEDTLVRRSHRLFLLFVLLAAVSASVSAQTDQTVIVRMLDTRTGLLIASSNYLVRVNHQTEEHGDWIKKNEDGSGSLTLPAEANVLTVHATYENATLTYVNCDSDKDRGSADHAPFPVHWYPVAAILSTGVVAPNNCVGKKIPEKLQVVAKPGEYVFFVRPLSSREHLMN
jgi:hypothetical protein